MRAALSDRGRRGQVTRQTIRSVTLSEAKGLWRRRFFAALRMTCWLDMAGVTTAVRWRPAKDEDGRRSE